MNEGATEGPTFTGGGVDDILALPVVAEGRNDKVTYPPAPPCEYCGRPGQHHEAGGFDTETEDEDAVEPEPNFDALCHKAEQQGVEDEDALNRFRPVPSASASKDLGQ